jgi:hypothetical protein
MNQSRRRKFPAAALINNETAYWNWITPVYMPIEQVNRKVEPFGCAGSSMVVSPVAGSIFWMFKDGITKAREHDWVFLVVSTS